MRKVLAQMWDTNTKAYKSVYGYFHCWGQTFYELPEGNGNETVAIIELENGTIITSLPGDVVFCDTREARAKYYEEVKTA